MAALQGKLRATINQRSLVTDSLHKSHDRIEHLERARAALTDQLQLRADALQVRLPASAEECCEAMQPKAREQFNR